MKLAELAFACYLYGRMTDSDSSYFRFLEETSPYLDLCNTQHRQALLNWLNDWGCRNFAIAHHPSASEEICCWYQAYGDSLFSLDKTLLELSDTDLASVSAAYANLLNRTASVRRVHAGGLANVKFGPTGTAKILFALRPNALVPWDEPVRSERGFTGSAEDYVRYLRFVRSQLEELDEACHNQHQLPSDLPGLLGRPNSSLAKLMDEYCWVTVTRNCPAPTSEELTQWAKWG
jgi:hypothetical protein